MNKTIVFVLGLALSLSGYAATNITGTVSNGTTKKPAVGAEVILLKLEGGMSEEARSKTDASGRYSIAAENAAAPHVVRVVYQNVSYNQPVPPNVTTADVKVYEAARKVAGVGVSVDVLWFESETNSKDLRVEEMIAVKNSSAPPKTQFSEAAFEFFLPVDAVLDSSAATSPGGVPLKVAPVPQSDRGHFAFPFPLRPGDTRFQLSYHLPYSGKYKLAQRVLYAADHVAIFVPKTMNFAPASQAFQAMKDGNGSEMQVATNVNAGQTMTFELSGYGVLPRENEAAGGGAPDAATADSRRDNNLPGGGLGRPEETPDALHNVRWYILGGFALLLGGGVFMMTRASGGANHAAPLAGDRGALLLDALKEEIFQLESDRINAKITSGEYEQAKAALDVALRRAMSRKP